MKIAEHKCRKLQMGRVLFSPTLNNDRKTISLWSAVIKKLTGSKMSMCRIIQLGHLVGIENPMSVTTQEAETKLKEAKKAYYNTKKNMHTPFNKHSWNRKPLQYPNLPITHNTQTFSFMKPKGRYHDEYALSLKIP